MEALREEIKEFLVISSGSGYGDGSGDGSGSGYGDGSGSGYGDGYGYGDGSGDGYGDGSGDGDGDGDEIKKYNGQSVYMIDNVPTLIERSRGNYAQGYILQSDLTTKPCFIAKYENYFAHGETLKEAFVDAQRKAFNNMPEEERIAKFLNAHEDKEAKYSAEDLFDWHGFLTGSCRFGREQFVREHNIDMGKDEYTLDEFVQLTEKEYGCEVIKKIKSKEL